MVNDLREHLAEIREVVLERKMEAKLKMKEGRTAYDQHATNRMFQEGDMVL